MGKRPQRVLIYRLGSLGDSVVALPCLHLIARRFPDADRRLLTNRSISNKASSPATVFSGTGLLQGYFEYPLGIRHFLPVITLWWQLVRWRPQVLIYLAAARGRPAARRDRLFFLACGIVHQVGVPDSDALQTNSPQQRGLYEAEAARLARCIAPLGDAHVEDPSSWDLHLTAAEYAAAQAAVAPAQGLPLLAISLGTKQQSGDWGTANWKALLVRLGAALSGYAVVLTGVASEAAATEVIAEGWRAANSGPVINLCGRLTPRETAAVFTLARAFVGHDSGPMHLAAAVRTPCIAIFSARQLPGIWFPNGSGHRVLYHQVDCRGCGLETCIVQRKRCVLSITVQEVAEQVLELLGASAAGRTAPDSAPDRYTFSVAGTP